MNEFFSHVNTLLDAFATPLFVLAALWLSLNLLSAITCLWIDQTAKHYAVIFNDEFSHYGFSPSFSEYQKRIAHVDRFSYRMVGESKKYFFYPSFDSVQHGLAYAAAKGYLEVTP